MIDEEFYNFSNEDKEEKMMNILQKSQYQDIKYIKLPRNLKFTDRLSMINNIESRIPLLDIDIAKYCFNIKNSLKLKNNINRWILKKSLNKVIKNIKFPKNKRSVVDPQTNWLKTNLKDYYLDSINSSKFRNLGIFNNQYLNKKFIKFTKDKKLLLVINFSRYYLVTNF